MKRYALILACFTLSACGATMISTRGEVRSDYAPTNETRGGSIKYRLLHQRTGREDAYKQMADYCEGPYRITEESQVSEYGGGTIVPAGLTLVTLQNHRPDTVYINFQCETVTK